MLVESLKDIGVVKKGDKFEVKDSEEGLILISAGWFRKEDFK